MTANDLQSIAFTAADGATAHLSDYAGKVVLVVNVASLCALTPQYYGLDRIYKERRDAGLVVLGFPSNDFAGQEPGTDAEIQTFCQTSYGVTFPIFAKVTVSGPDKHPLFDALTSHAPETTKQPGLDFRSLLSQHGNEPNPDPEILWNFEKFLIGRDGRIVARFSPNIPPDAPLILDAIDAALAQPA